jgi:predicted metal-dependent HD superfamily phosphohydrolase
MKERWLGFWTRAGAAGDAEAPWRLLSARYAEPQRPSHTLGHVAHCLEEFDAARDLARDPVAVEMALWYHDVVYDPRSVDNEKQSADLAAEAAVEMGLSAARATRVAELILVSTHRALAADPDAQLFADIDLAILGQAAAAFDQYEGQIRVEYAWVPEAAFRAGRSTILKSFLDRPSIYATPFFRKKYEAAARRNLSASLLRGRQA